MDTDFRCFAGVHLWGESATHSPAPRSARHAALLLLAGSSPQRRRALPGTPITALASAFNCRIQVEMHPLSRFAPSPSPAGGGRTLWPGSARSPAALSGETQV